MLCGRADVELLDFFFPLFYYYYCSYGAYFPSLFAGRAANGKLGCPPVRPGSRSPSASEGRGGVRRQRLGMTPRAPAEHKPWVERTAGIYFSQPHSPPFPLPALSSFLLYKICISNTVGEKKINKSNPQDLPLIQAGFILAYNSVVRCCKVLLEGMPLPLTSQVL